MLHLARLVCGCLLLGLAGSALAAAASGMEAETLELVRQVDRDTNAAVRDARRELAEARRGHDEARELRAWRLLALAHNELLDMVALQDDIAHGEPLALKLGHLEAQCHFLAARAAVERNAGRYAQSDALFDQAIALAQHHGFERMIAALHLDKAMTAIEHGRQADAFALLVKAHAIFEARKEALGTALTLDSMGTATLMAGGSGDLPSAIRYHEQALQLLDPDVNRAGVIMVVYNLGLAHYRARNLREARRHAERGLALTLAYQGPVGAAYFEYTLARVAHDEKRHADALAHLDRALPGFKLRGDLPLMVFSVHTSRAEALSSMGRYADSLQSLEAARPMLADLQSPVRDAHFHKLAAEIHARGGRFELAYRALQEHGAAERRRLEAVNSERTAELKTRFDVERRESENMLLRTQQQEASARRMVLFLALALTLVVLGVLAVYLIHQMRRSRRYAALAMRDELTGLPNRRSIVEFARLQWTARLAHEGKLRVALLDIDHFKSVNDEFGHDVGDAVLAAFAEACAANLRSSDRLGRYGGEEFLLVMPGSDAAQVPAVFGRLQRAVAALAVPGLPAERRLSFSMGTAEAWGENDTLDAAIHRADEALYLAKQNGRNRCEAAPRVRLAASTPAAADPARVSPAVPVRMH